jgi:Cu(I)/Ag(I) efflux system membrane fusion protein
VNVEVTAGLSAGERVVTRANFLVDSESRLRASLAEMSTGTTTPRGPDRARVLPETHAPAPPADGGMQMPAPPAHEHGRPRP